MCVCLYSGVSMKKKENRKTDGYYHHHHPKRNTLAFVLRIFQHTHTRTNTCAGAIEWASAHTPLNFNFNLKITEEKKKRTEFFWLVYSMAVLHCENEGKRNDLRQFDSIEFDIVLLVYYWFKRVSFLLSFAFRCSRGREYIYVLVSGWAYEQPCVCVWVSAAVITYRRSDPFRVWNSQCQCMNLLFVSCRCLLFILLPYFIWRH